MYSSGDFSRFLPCNQTIKIVTTKYFLSYARGLICRCERSLRSNLLAKTGGCFPQVATTWSILRIAAQDGQVGIQPSEAGGAFERGARIKPIAEVHEQGKREQAIGPREKRPLIEQDEVIDAAQSVRSGLAAGGKSHWLF